MRLADLNVTGGRGEIRTHERLATLPVFKTGALNHSATLPAPQDQALSTDRKRTPSEHCHRIATAFRDSRLCAKFFRSFCGVCSQATPQFALGPDTGFAVCFLRSSR